MAIKVKESPNSDVYFSAFLYRNLNNRSSISQELKICITYPIWMFCGKCFLEL